MSVWLLAFFYWIHLMGTVILIGGLTLIGLMALPAWQVAGIAENQWLVLQKKFMPWANGSLVILLITGFVQMTNDSNYNGFLAIDTVWAGAMLVKHLAFVGMVGLTVYVQARIHPAMERMNLLLHQKEKLATAELTKLRGQEMQLLRLNLVCGLVVLFCTGVATAV